MESKNDTDLGELDAMLNELNDVVCKHIGNSSETKITLQNIQGEKQLIIQIGTVSELMILFEKD